LILKVVYIVKIVLFSGFEVKVMDKHRLSVEVCEILESLFMLDTGTVKCNSLRRDILAWDSLQQVNVILELEGRYSVHFEIEEIDKLVGVESIVEVIFRKVQNT